jgi:NADH-quinone oxidoreductase subunit J
MLIFKFLVGVNLFFAVMVIFSSKVLYSILSLVFLIITGCLVLLVLEIEFLSFIIMLLYIGAIAVLFLFVVMMLQLNKNNSKYLKMSFLSTGGILYLLFGLKFIFFSFYLNKKLSNFIYLFSYKFTSFHYDSSYSFVNSLLVGGDSILFLSLFTQKYYFFVVVGVILLFAMVGSIVLCVNQTDVD